MTAALCAEGTTSVVNMLAIVGGRRAPGKHPAFRFDT
jgi:hypothetical protein